MKCRTCGRGMADGAALFRQNAKGEVGIWECELHNKAPVDEGVSNIVGLILEDNARKP